MTQLRLSRRRILRFAAALPIPFLAAACGGGSTAPSGGATETAEPPDDATQPPSPVATASPGQATQPPNATPTTAVLLEPTPECGDDDDEPTVAQTEGPYFTPNSPERVSLLEQGVAGIPLVVSGHVVTTECQPVAGALIDFWQCDDAGVYDNDGYRLRGHQFTGEGGNWELETILPGAYPGRTRHIHVKVQAPDQPVLTTQLYFPGEPGNLSDRIFDERLVLDIAEESDGVMTGTFQIVLDVS
jgi:protocatechuate 3,4-dioxygenase beta subunit